MEPQAKRDEAVMMLRTAEDLVSELEIRFFLDRDPVRVREAIRQCANALRVGGLT